jgi:hypothetical protein
MSARDVPGNRPDRIHRADEPDQEFDVRDSLGHVRATLVRTANKEFFWRSADGRPGLGGVAVEDLPLYGSELLRRIPLDVPVVLTEGPKDCIACRRAGLVALGTITGAAGTPSGTSLDVLRDRVVVLWPDNDTPGAEHMRRVAEALVGVAFRVCVVDVTGLPPKAGAADLTAVEVVRRVARALQAP